MELNTSIRQSSTWHASLNIVLFAALLFGAAFASCVAAPSLSKSAVISTARAFCAAAGVAPAIVVTAQPPSARRVPNAHHWRPVWAVNAGPADIEVADPSGIVVAYARHRPLPGASTGAPVDETGAVGIAKSLLSASGQNAELGDEPTATRKAAGELAPGFPACWLVSWPRVFNGVPYRDDAANALIEADNGAALRFAVNFHAPSPSDVTETVTAEQAVTAALKSAEEQTNSHDLVTMPPRKMVVFVPMPEGKGAERVVWNCAFQVSPKKSFEVWIDIATGNNIGGGPVTTP